MYNYFSGLFNTRSGYANNNMSLYSSFSQLSSIKNGSYGMLLKQHYGNLKVSNSDSTKSTKVDELSTESLYESFKTKASSKETVTAADKKALTDIGGKTEDLTISATALYTKGSKSAFASGKAEDAVAAVKDFVSDYNSLVSAAQKSNISAVKKETDNLIGDVKTYEKGLSKVGISIADDGTLALDNKKLDNMDVDALKDVFSGSNSVAYKVAFKALSLGQTAANASSTTYTGDGQFKNNTNSIFDSYL